MNAFDQFDLVDARIANAIEDLAAATRPDYIDDVLKVTALRRQRPRWTFVERLLPMDTAIRRPMVVRRLPIRALVVLLLLLLAAATAAFIVGSRPRVPAPFGPAANGQVLYVANGDLYVRDALETSGRLLVSRPGDQFAPTWSPDGQWISFVTTTTTGDEVMVARADGSDAHQIAAVPSTGNAQAAWRPDSRAVGFIYSEGAVPTLSIAFVDGSPTQRIDLGMDLPTELAWRPPNGAELLVRVVKPGAKVDYLTIRPDGTARHDFGLPSDRLIDYHWDNPGAAWSPDGSRIAYDRVAQIGDTTVGGTFRIHVMNADGTGDVALPAPTDLGVQEGWPLFSPDGRWILVNRWTWKTDDQGSREWLAVAPADGSAPARDIGPRIIGGDEMLLGKAWSPDGTRVIEYSGNERKGYSIDPVTGNMQDIDWTTAMPDWQRTVH